MKRLTRAQRSELWPWAIVAAILGIAAGQIFPLPEQFPFYVGVAVGLAIGGVTMFVVPEDEE